MCVHKLGALSVAERVVEGVRQVLGGEGREKRAGAVVGNS